MTIALLLLGSALFVLLALWVTRKMMDKGNRCPTCGVDRDKYPHKPRCNYWGDR